MSTYYGVPSTPNDSFLIHYGVKGMKWGVRRARENGNQRALSRHYSAASNKLRQLTAKSDRDLVRSIKKYNTKEYAKAALGSGLMSGGLTMGLNSHLPMPERLKWSAVAGGIGAGASALVGGGDRLYWSAIGSKSGNAKQNAKRKAWEKEMRRAFKGTRYAGQIDKTKRDINRQVELLKRQYDPDYRPNRKSNKRRR